MSYATIFKRNGVLEFRQWRKYGRLLQFVTQEYKCRIHVRTEDVRIYLVAFSYQCSR